MKYWLSPQFDFGGPKTNPTGLWWICTSPAMTSSLIRIQVITTFLIAPCLDGPLEDIKDLKHRIQVITSFIVSSILNGQDLFMPKIQSSGIRVREAHSCKMCTYQCFECSLFFMFDSFDHLYHHICSIDQKSQRPPKSSTLPPLTKAILTLI
jgi:hypothetical protein